MTGSPHLWLALSPHGFGHAAMTAPLVAELRRRRPGLRLTIQTSLPADFLASRYGAFRQVAEIPDFGLRMVSSTQVHVADSAAGYAALHADFPGVVAREAARLREAAPDLVLANVPYVTIAAAAAAGIPVAAFSSLNWADMFAQYLRDMPDARRIEREMREAYGQAAFFLRCTPAQVMTLPNLREVGVVAAPGRDRRAEVLARVGAAPGTRLGLISFGGIDHGLPLEAWPSPAGWLWINGTAAGRPDGAGRPDMVSWRDLALPFSDLIPSVDAIVTKPGYGMFSEAGVVGTPVLYLPRPGWPECPHLENWLSRHAQALPVTPEELFGPALPLLLQRLLALPKPNVAVASGAVEAIDRLEGLLGPASATCERS